MHLLQCGRHQLDLTQPVVMGILNITTDSFSDGGQFIQRDQALYQAEKMLNDGAAIIDVGGESTRPGAQFVTESEELERVLPIIEALADFPVPISVDTNKASVMTAAVAAGATLINDVCALQQPDALAAAVNAQVPVCLMHMQGEPRTMQANPHYEDVVSDIYQLLAQRIEACLEAGLTKAQLLVDPGFGFGKTLQHNLILLRHLEKFNALGVPLLVGMSRKRMIGDILDKPVTERVQGSVAAALLAAERGAQILRVHDVAATVDALKILQAVVEKLILRPPEYEK